MKSPIFRPISKNGKSDYDNTLFGYPNPSSCPPFNGKDGKSVARWLLKFETYHTISPSEYLRNIPPSCYLQSVNILLAEDAEIWADTTEEIVEIFAKDDPTQEDVDTFRPLFTLKYPAHHVVPFDFYTEVSELHQKPGESLASYYDRTVYLLRRGAGRDFSKISRVNQDLSLLKKAALENVIDAFFKGFNGQYIGDDSVLSALLNHGSLHELYAAAVAGDIAAKKVKSAEESTLRSTEPSTLLPQRDGNNGTQVITVRSQKARGGGSDGDRSSANEWTEIGDIRKKA